MFSAVRRALRNESLTGGPRTILLSSGLLFLAACTQLAGLEGPDLAPGARHGSPAPGTGVPPDTTLPPAPRDDCGDVANDATNCGYCGHSCRGGTCSDGLCSTTTVARSAARIDAFVTDGTDVFMIEANAVRACASATPDACREIVTGDAVGQRMIDLSQDFPDWGQFGDGRGSGPGPKKGVVGLPPLSPTAIALHQGRVFVADDEYKVLVACPATGVCTGAQMGLVDVDWTDDDDDETPTLGRSLAVAQGSVAWTQGDAIRMAAIPAAGNVERRIAERRDGTTNGTARVAGWGATNLFWLSDTGLHHAAGSSSAAEQWFSLTARDFSFDTQRVYVAGADGLFRISRTDRSAALAASGSFEHVAVDPGGVFAAKSEGGRTTVVEARADMQLPLAVVDGAIEGLAVAGDHVYFMTRVGEGSEIRRVAR